MIDRLIKRIVTEWLGPATTLAIAVCSLCVLLHLWLPNGVGATASLWVIGAGLIWIALIFDFGE